MNLNNRIVNILNLACGKWMLFFNIGNLAFVYLMGTDFPFFLSSIFSFFIGGLTLNAGKNNT